MDSPSNQKPHLNGTPTHVQSRWTGRDSRHLGLFAVSCFAATSASQVLPHIDAHTHPKLAFLCICALLLNLSAAISTVALTGMKIDLEFRLARMQRLERLPRLLYLNWIVCSVGGMTCLIAVVAAYGFASFKWT